MGPFVGALIGALPTAAGAAYTILALEHPPDFIAASAVGSVAVNAAVAIFAATYAAAAQRHGLFVSLGVASVVWFAAAAALRLSTGRRSAPSLSMSWCSPSPFR